MEAGAGLSLYRWGGGGARLASNLLLVNPPPVLLWGQGRVFESKSLDENVLRAELLHLLGLPHRNGPGPCSPGWGHRMLRIDQNRIYCCLPSNYKSTRKIHLPSFFCRLRIHSTMHLLSDGVFLECIDELDWTNKLFIFRDFS